MKKILAMILILAVSLVSQPTSDEALEEWKKQREAEKNQYQQQVDSVRDEYRKQVEAERKKWAEMVKEVRGKWGKYVDSTPKAWAEYGNDLNSLSVVDFENNKVQFEVIITDEDDKKAEDLFAKRYNDVLKEEDPYTKKPILDGQIESGTKIEDKMGNVEKEVIIGDDGRARTKYKITLDMVPNSIQKRAEKYIPLVKDFSDKYSLDPALVLALIHTESAFNPKAYSRRPDGTPMAIGLMQIIPTQAGRDAHKALYGSDKIVSTEYLFDPKNNVEMGTWYVKWLMKWWQRQEKKRHGKVSSNTKIEYYSISSYNQGMGTILKRYKARNYFAMSEKETYIALNTDNKISKEGRDYIQRVVDRKKLYKVN